MDGDMRGIMAIAVFVLLMGGTTVEEVFGEPTEQAGGASVEEAESLPAVEETEELPDTAESGETGRRIDESAAEDVFRDDCSTVEETTEEPSGGLTREGGVNQHGDRLETYYSSNVAYHWQTPEWRLDEDGFYRTDEGYYVVAASDMEQGTVFEGSRGLCQVLDCGCEDGVTDYYTAW